MENIKYTIKDRFTDEIMHEGENANLSNADFSDANLYIVDKYVGQMAENRAMKIDTNFWLVVKQKPKWMPSFLYRAVIKELVEFQEHRTP